MPRRIHHCTMFRKRQLIAVLLWLMGIASLSGQPREIWERYELGVVAGGAASVPWGAYLEGFRQALAEVEEAEKGRIAFTLHVQVPHDEKGLGQVEALRQMFVEGVQGIGAEADDAKELEPMLTFLGQREIPVVLFGREEMQSGAFATVITDNVQAGRMLFNAASQAYGQRRHHRTLLEHKPRTGKFAVLAGPLEDPTVQSRLRGLKEAEAEAASVKIIGVYHHNGTMGDAIRVLRETEAADRDKEINGWIFLDDLVMLGDGNFPWSRGTKPCVAINAGPQTLRFIRNGYVQYMVTHDYPKIGHEAGRVLAARIHGKQEPENRIILVEPLLITPDNVAVFSENWIRWLR